MRRYLDALPGDYAASVGRDRFPSAPALTDKDKDMRHEIRFTPKQNMHTLHAADGLRALLGTVFDGDYGVSLSHGIVWFNTGNTKLAKALAITIGEILKRAGVEDVRTANAE